MLGLTSTLKSLIYLLKNVLIFLCIGASPAPPAPLKALRTGIFVDLVKSLEIYHLTLKQQNMVVTGSIRIRAIKSNALMHGWFMRRINVILF